MWDIKLGAEDLLDLHPGLERGQWEKCGKSQNQTKWSHFWTPVFSFSLCAVGYRDCQSPAWLPLKIIFQTVCLFKLFICAYFKMHSNTIT